ncbi:hypothetical protein [Nocardioides dongxiaopingii]|uniref:hypothetical protein n=1 Tax=Nocardioides dongxiaopingii TaxID=2576036 RepID=UPI0010C761C7|nr:hypothetical protein [Nocardioides dongxiaopingii]
MTGPLQEAAGRVYADWPVTEMEDGNGYAVDVEGSAGAWSALVLADDENLVFCFYSLSPVDVPEGDEAAMQRMSEFVDRANLGLVAATFELDRDNGEVRLRTGLELATLPAEILVQDGFLDAVVLDLSAANIGVMDKYLSGLVATVMSDVPVAEIVAQVEA